jgi:hypothetical protein
MLGSLAISPGQDNELGLSVFVEFDGVIQAFFKNGRWFVMPSRGPQHDGAIRGSVAVEMSNPMDVPELSSNVCEYEEDDRGNDAASGSGH